MSGTDRTKTGLDLDGPAIILVEPQLGENIGMAARAMGNFALSRLRIVNPRRGLPHNAPPRAGGCGAGILCGRERAGLTNEEVALANRIITFPVNPGFASLNLAQAVLLMGYECFKHATENALPFAMPERSERASQHQMDAFFENLVRELDRVEFLRPVEKRDTMLVNLRNIFFRMERTRQNMTTLQGVLWAIAEGRRGPPRAACSMARRRRGCARCSPNT